MIQEKNHKKKITTLSRRPQYHNDWKEKDTFFDSNTTCGGEKLNWLNTATELNQFLNLSRLDTTSIERADNTLQTTTVYQKIKFKSASSEQFQT